MIRRDSTLVPTLEGIMNGPYLAFNKLNGALNDGIGLGRFGRAFF